jgi:uncharacterized membrane protein
VYFFSPMLMRQPILGTHDWNRILTRDLAAVRFHISIWEALGRRLRRNYIWIFGVLGASYVGKLLVHPTALTSLDQLWERAAEGPIPGQVVIASGVLIYGALAALAAVTLVQQRAAGRAYSRTGQRDEEDPITRLAI